MSVLAKFKCESKDNDQSTVNLRAVYDSDPESVNGQFFKMTPMGEIKMGILNEAAYDQFEIGKEYFVEFQKAEG